MTNIIELKPAPRPAPTPDQYRPTTQDLILFVAIARRDIRKTIHALDTQREAASQYRRQARKLKERGGLFDASRVASLNSAAEVADVASELLREDLKASGEFLADFAPMFDAGTTLAQRCDILGVNMTDRGDLTEKDGLMRIVNGHGLEDSAYHRGEDWKSGPLYRATETVMMDFLLNTAEGQALGNSLCNSLFEPGGIFANVPMYTRQPDGTMKRLPPKLSVVPATLH